MMRLADMLARELRCRALVTGENLGQVASQTMQALAVSEDVATMPVLRPLIGLDKEEIVKIARKIGTFDTSILPYEDCCTVFTPRHPKTKPSVEETREYEGRAGRGGPVPAGHGQPGDDPRQAPVLRRRIPCPVLRRSSLSATSC